MRFTLDINCDNAAFDDDDLFHEVARILRDLATKVEDHDADRNILDVNGNFIGIAELIQD